MITENGAVRSHDKFNDSTPPNIEGAEITQLFVYPRSRRWCLSTIQLYI